MCAENHLFGDVFEELNKLSSFCCKFNLLHFTVNGQVVAHTFGEFIHVRTSEATCVVLKILPM
jgi:hypothetical protein